MSQLVMMYRNLDNARCLRIAILFPVVLAIAGCQSGPLYQAAALPPEYMAPHFGSMRSVDWSRFSQSLSDSQLLYPGDIVAITITTGLESEEPTTWKGRIADDGTVNVPLVGQIPIAGLQVPYAEQLVRQESITRGKFVNPNVALKIDARQSNAVTVMGAVKKPGTFELPVHDSHVLSAIARAEGLEDDADTVIEIRHPPQAANLAQAGYPPNGAGPAWELAGFRRGSPPLATPPRTVRIDLEQATRMGNADFHLEDGSTVMVMPRPKRYVHVIGLVRKPDQFEMPPDHEIRLLDAIALANGRTLELADKVRVIRTVPNQQEPVVIEASVQQAKSSTAANLRLAPGDVVSVEETPLTFVVGTIRDFVRFGFTAGIPGL